MEYSHYSVLLNEVIEGLNINPDGIYVDGTLGGAGHSYQILQKLSNKGKLIGIDRDKDAIHESNIRLEKYHNKLLICDNYKNIKTILKNNNIDKINGCVLDLGVSSYQIDNIERGFSYVADTTLDMRMDRSQGLDAIEVINTYSQDDLYRIIKEYGEERFASRIARNIVSRRSEHKITTTGQLKDIIYSSIPRENFKHNKHPEKRTFQAIRIEVNSELKPLENALEDIIDVLDDNGRLCVISFHSLEDRIVKNVFKKCQDPCTCPPNIPICVCGKKSKGNIITKKPILPSTQELEENSRSSSAKLRIFERKYL